MPYILVLISVLLFSFNNFAQNRTIKNGGDFIGVLLLNNLPLGALLMAVCLFTLNLEEVSVRNWCLIGLTNVFWTGAAYFRTKSYRDLDVSMVGILGAVKLILLSVCGIIFFKEQLSVCNVVGMILTIAAILYSVDFHSVSMTRGARCCFIGILFGVGGVVLSKFLSTQVPTLLIVAADFFLPGIALWLISRNAKSAVLSAYRANRRAMLLVPFVSIFSYYIYITAFAMGGQLVVISILQQTGLVVVLGIEYFFLKMIPNFQRRCLAGGVCTVGAVLVAAF